jgi:hypothetical protein
MTPILLPAPGHWLWQRAEIIVSEFRAAKKSNPWIIAALANGFAESNWTAKVAGDHGKSFGPWQINYGYFGEEILAKTNVDIRTETDLRKQCQALLWLLENFEANGKKAFAKVVADLNAAKTGAEATRIWCVEFERAGAAGAADRRVAIAPAIGVWLAKLHA